MSKGAKYKKPQKKKYYSKKDWMTLGVAVGVLAVIVTVFLIVVNQGTVRLKNGVYQIAKNEIAANYGGDTSKRFQVIGKVGNIDGFTLDDDSKNSLVKYLSPTDAENIKSANLGGSAYQYQELASKMSGIIADQYEIDAPTPTETTIAGRDAAYFTYIMPGTADTGKDKVDDSTPDQPIATAYIDYDGDHCVFIEIVFKGALPQTDEIMRQFANIANGLKLK